MSHRQGLVRIIDSHSLNVSFILLFIISLGRLYIEKCKNAPVLAGDIIIARILGGEGVKRPRIKI